MSCCNGASRIGWAGVVWLGLPMPVRVGTWVWAAFTDRTNDTLEEWIHRFPQCGCWEPAKRLFGG